MVPLDIREPILQSFGYNNNGGYKSG